MLMLTNHDSVYSSLVVAEQTPVPSHCQVAPSGEHLNTNVSEAFPCRQLVGDSHHCRNQQQWRKGVPFQRRHSCVTSLDLPEVPVDRHVPHSWNADFLQLVGSTMYAGV